MMAAQETAVQANGSRVKKFFREVKAEMRKVSWPNKKELIAYTGVVFISVVFIAALIGLIDGVFVAQALFFICLLHAQKGKIGYFYFMCFITFTLCLEVNSIVCRRRKSKKLRN